MRRFIEISIPLILLLVPEFWKSAFEWLRQSPSWRYLQILMVLWIVVVVTYPLITYLTPINRPAAVGVAALIGAVLFGGIALWVTALNTPAVVAEQPVPATPSLPLGGGMRMRGHSQLEFHDNLFPDTLNFEAEDFAKAKFSQNVFYSTKPQLTIPPPQASPASPPNFTSKIWNVDFIGTKDSKNQNHNWVFAELEIVNGGSQSIANEFRATFKSGGKTLDNLRPIAIASTLTIRKEDGSRTEIKESDLLYNTASVNPISSGGRGVGFLPFSIGGITNGPPKDFELTIYFRDATGKEYSATESSRTMEHGGVAIYVPGINNPFHPTPPAPTPDKEAPEQK